MGNFGYFLRLFVFLGSSPQPNFDFFGFWGQALSGIFTFLAFGVKPSAEFSLVWLLRSSPSAENRLFDFWDQALSRILTFLALGVKPSAEFSLFLLLRSLLSECHARRGFLFSREKSTFDFSKSLLSEGYARRGFLFVNMPLRAR